MKKMKINWLFLIFVLIAGIVGRITLNRAQYHSAINKYIENKERPTAIVESLKKGRLAKGMTQKEVEMLLGEPTEIRTNTYDNSLIKWTYLSRNPISLKRSYVDFDENYIVFSFEQDL